MDEKAKEIPHLRLRGLSFGTFLADELKKLSVKEITNPITFDALRHPTRGGLYDPALGPLERFDICLTCGLSNLHCPGHMGHVSLPLPVYNPVLFSTLILVLRGTCFHCHQLRCLPATMYLVTAQLKALEMGLIGLVNEFQMIFYQLVAAHGSPKAIYDELKESIEEKFAEISESADCKKQVKNVIEVHQHLQKEVLNGKFWQKSARRCSICNKSCMSIRSEQCTKMFFTRSGFREKEKKKFQKAKASKKYIKQVQDESGYQVEAEGSDNEAAIQQVTAILKSDEYLTPTAVKEHLEQVWNNHSDFLQRLFGSTTEEPLLWGAFFIDVLPIPPPRFRPLAIMKGNKYENAQSANYARVLQDCLSIRELLVQIRNKKSDGDTSVLSEEITEESSSTAVSSSTKTLNERLQANWLNLQTHINCIVDSDLDKLSRDKSPGIRQLLEKKEGLFRMNMMGKRVNYAARSVISPDPYIATNEIGIPEVFATKLTYPQPVTPWNFKELKQAVINGPMIHPGATHIVNENGSLTFLKPDNQKQREAIAKSLLTPGFSVEASQGRSKQVYRHLRNGDVLLLNRQPTLHRPSIQAHRARILPGEKTLRLHYANCKAYNADFDGDEMNAHFPQNELARSEAYNLMATDYQYLTPKDGTPLAGLIQDHMVSGIMLTIRGRFFTKHDYQQLVFCALTNTLGAIRQVPPSIRKPQHLWSGKQVLSTVMLNTIPRDKPRLNLVGKSKVSGKNWINDTPREWLAGGDLLQGDNMSESEVVISDGQLLVGVLDKGHYGATPFGLVHCCYELYGGPVAGCLLTSLARLFTTFLQLHGFTLGVEDILVKPKADRKRKKIMKKGRRSGEDVAAKLFKVENDPEGLVNTIREAHFGPNSDIMKDLDLAMKGCTDGLQNEIAKVCMGQGLHKTFPHNNLQLMVQSGAKGSSVNCMQISCLLGQIELEGRRPPLMLSGRSLPSFMPYDTSPRAGGFVDGRFLTGIRPQEYFFHCMAGREGLVDTAVKTSRSGYLQRCLIKHLEGLSINYDMTVRDSDGSIVQFQYGEDNMDVTKVPFLDQKQFPFVIQNQEAILPNKELSGIKNHMNTENAPVLWKKFRKWKKKEKKNTLPRNSGFLKYSASIDVPEVMEHTGEDEVKTGRTEVSQQLCQQWAEEDEATKAKYEKKVLKAPDPIVSQLKPTHYFGSVTERFEDVIESYLSKNPDKMIFDEDAGSGKLRGISAEKFKTVLYARYMQGLIPPGESVGLLAAQSIGEPSTQMTLNTFHFAGRGEMNVTLGIPRLREILMVASLNIRTPTMEVPVLQTTEALTKAQDLKRKFNRVYLNQVLEDINITEQLSIKKAQTRGRDFKIHFRFLPARYYKTQYYLTPQTILAYMERRFFHKLQDNIKKKIAEIQYSKFVQSSQVRHSSEKNSETDAIPSQDAENDISDEECDDDDATAAKNRERQTQECDYQGEEEEQQELGVEDNGLEEDDDEGVDVTMVEEVENTSQIDTDQIYELQTDTTKQSKHKSKTATMDIKRINYLLGQKDSFAQIIEYQYDAKEELWCEVTIKVPLMEKKIDMTSILQQLAETTVVYETPGISRCFLNESKRDDQKGQWVLKTEGYNLPEMWHYEDILDINCLYTNHIHIMAQTYGIEAACKVIIKEVQSVFAAYGITVDYRHLSMIADYMTFEGVYKPFNRVGLNSHPSPLQKMSFESTMSFLKKATVMGGHDDLRSPSAQLVVGRMVEVGTGCFDLLQPLTL